MAKATKPKVAVTKKEETKKIEEVQKVVEKFVPIPDTLKPLAEDIVNDSVSEPEIKQPEAGDTPPSVTLDEVADVKEEANNLVVKVNPEPVSEFKGTVDYKVSEELSNEQKLLNFLESREVLEIKLNDFLKSLYGVPKFGEPSLALTQASSKEIRNMLDKINNGGEYKIVNDLHKRLATFYYPDTETMKTEWHNINSIPLVAVKVN